MQNNLNKLEKDCVRVNERIDTLLADDADARAANRKAAYYGYSAFLLSLVAPLLTICILLHRSGVVASMAQTASIPLNVVDAFGEWHVDSKMEWHVAFERNGMLARPVPAALTASHRFPHVSGETCDAIVAPHLEAPPTAPTDGSALAPPPSAGGLLSMTQLLCGAALFFGALQIVSKLLRRYEPSYTKREHANLLATQKYVSHDLLELKHSLYKLYLNDCTSELEYQ